MECALSVIVSTGLSGWWFSGMWASVLVLSVVLSPSEWHIYIGCDMK